jgi:hypothetical protein
MNEAPTAFPWTHDNVTCTGMTLRDYFAAKAMQMEMQSTKEYYNNGECDVSEWRELFVNIAEHAYDMADEMLKARTE